VVAHSLSSRVTPRPFHRNAEQPATPAENDHRLRAAMSTALRHTGASGFCVVCSFRDGCTSSSRQRRRQQIEQQHRQPPPPLPPAPTPQIAQVLQQQHAPHGRALIWVRAAGAAGATAAAAPPTAAQKSRQLRSLMIVESPAKAVKIQKFLGDGYTVRSSVVVARAATITTNPTQPISHPTASRTNAAQRTLLLPSNKHQTNTKRTHTRPGPR
jgi:hypothetical protein